MLKSEIVAKFGAQNAEAIIMRKLQDPLLLKTEVRRHPELPDAQDMMQFLILDMEQVSTEREDVMEMLYKLAEGKDSEHGSSSSEDSSASQKKKKKAKNKKTKSKKAIHTFHTCIHSQINEASLFSVLNNKYRIIFPQIQITPCLRHAKRRRRKQRRTTRNSPSKTEERSAPPKRKVLDSYLKVCFFG